MIIRMYCRHMFVHCDFHSLAAHIGAHRRIRVLFDIRYPSSGLFYEYNVNIFAILTKTRHISGQFKPKIFMSHVKCKRFTVQRSINT